MIRHASIPLDISADEIKAVKLRHEFGASLMCIFKQAAKKRGDLTEFRIFRKAERRQRQMAEAYSHVVPEV